MRVNLQNNHGVIVVDGELTFATVNYLLKNAKTLFCQQQDLIFDFSQIQRCDSAGIAVLLTWLKIAKQRAMKICFKNFIPQMQQIVNVCGLAGIIRDEG